MGKWRDVGQSVQATLHCSLPEYAPHAVTVFVQTEQTADWKQVGAAAKVLGLSHCSRLFLFLWGNKPLFKDPSKDSHPVLVAPGGNVGRMSKC